MVEPGLKGPQSVGMQSPPYRKRNIWKSEFRQEDAWVEKDYSGAPLLPRLYGMISLHWEAVALRRLQGIEGVPTYLGRPKSLSLRMTRLPGTPLDRLKAGELSEECFHRLQELLKQIHSRGVAHGDLHMRNILIHSQKPSIIDFATAYVRGRLPLLDKNVFNLIMLLDLERLYKIEMEFFGRGTPPRMFYLYKLIKGNR
jgi:hypothetical protein